MRKRIWLRWVLVLAGMLFAASAVFSQLLQGNAARRYLLAHLQASFGRPVEVERFHFSLLNGAQLEAQSVTVAEDPQFGNDYFLRAESLTAGLRWSALLAGHIEFGSVFLTRPSLNLVRDSQGRWNIERWLPPAPAGAPVQATATRPSTRSPFSERLDEIDVEGGRINFKKGEDKAEFALVNVSGSAEQESPGRWRLDLDAMPMRVGVELQDIGTLRLRGSIGGTSARLQPAQLNIGWRGVSLADALRLANHFDSGMRGTMDLDVTASIAPASAQVPAISAARAQWKVSAVARLQGIHGWRLPPRDSDPAANVTMEAAWRLGEPQVIVSKVLLEMPQSHVQGSGGIEWSHGLNPSLHIESSIVGFADVAAFVGALRPEVAQDLSAQGMLGMDATLSGWPLQVTQCNFASDGGVLTASALPAALHVGPIHAAMSRGALDFGTEFAFVPAAPKKSGTQAATVPSAVSPVNSFMVRGAILPDVSNAYRWPLLWTLAVDGATPRVQDWTQLAQVLGQPMNTGWTAAGDVAVSIRGARNTYASAPAWSGSVDTRGALATLPFLNQPLRLPAAHADFSSSQLTLTVSAAQAFGATWHGTLARKMPGSPWTFDLTADALDVADLDRWLGPRARPGLLAALGFSGGADVDPQGQARDGAIAGLAAHGRLRVGSVALASLRLETFDGDVEVAGRSILVHKAQAGFFGGQVNGSFEADVLAEPSYRFQGRFDRVDLSRLSRAVPSLSSRFAGIASASLNLSAHGVGRANLIPSLEGAGELDARNAEMRGVDLSSSGPAGNVSIAPFLFASAKGTFRIKNGAVDTVNFVLADSSRRFEAEGRIDFSQLMTLQIHPLAPLAKSQASLSSEGFVLAGTVEDPRLTVSEDRHPASQAGAAPARFGR